MKLSHLNAIAQSIGFNDIKQYIQTRYIDENKSLEYMSDEIEFSAAYIAKLAAEFGIQKPEQKIPLTLADAKSLDLMTIAKNLGVSRATAWRWKRKVLADEAIRIADADDEAI
ncbi:MAG TPA: hypothetical protein PK129_17600 [Cellvibrionaceae bacterium]|nr:hypothetical protein [Cellvibrionaceae bacterium]